ncbi:hypothetical protein GPJ56_006730 [Histomonas meleagridis]|uniref:uncharacterized protein n=1 Tax=Histomonas meleagridis TaxID=135588 RepID=UPI00355A4834|nr:hypothetical protein GPJ56_006730 [Histomonas meleagridis]KAH0804890.1 hypothetical protein GO595_002312 [Histomonas meleagridis]
MFEPNRIGPISELYYSRNKGRVLQRKYVPRINPPLTKHDLDRAYEVLKNNGRVADYTVQYCLSSWFNQPSYCIRYIF